MKRNSRRFAALLLAPIILLYASGCDAADIVFASLDLAGAIVDVAS